MFESNGQSATFFFVSEVTRAKTQTVNESPVEKPTATAPVKVAWVSRER